MDSRAIMFKRAERARDLLAACPRAYSFAQFLARQLRTDPSLVQFIRENVAEKRALGLRDNVDATHIAAIMQRGIADTDVAVSQFRIEENKFKTIGMVFYNRDYWFVATSRTVGDEELGPRTFLCDAIRIGEPANVQKDAAICNVPVEPLSLQQQAAKKLLMEPIDIEALPSTMTRYLAKSALTPAGEYVAVEWKRKGSAAKLPTVTADMG